MDVRKTTDYFKMSIDELLEERNDAGYTREECKLFDEAIKVTFFDDITEYEEEKEGLEKWIKTIISDPELIAILETINGRIAVLYS